MFRAVSADRPLAVEIVVLDGFSLMSLAATMEPLRAANRVVGRPLYDWWLSSRDGGPVGSSSGLQIPVARPFHAEQARDMLIVVAAFDADRHAPAIQGRLRSIARRSLPVGGIESGSWVLARAGLLNGYHATVHWEEIDEFRTRFPAVRTVSDRFVVDRDRFTAGGAAPALDMMLHMIRIQHGLTVALNVSSVFVYDQDHLPTDRQPIVSLGRLGLSVPKLAIAVQAMEASIAEPLPIEAIAAKVELSSRALQSLFIRHLGKPPHAYFLDLRLDAARRLLSQSDWSVSAVAAETGFGSASSFARAFRRRYQVTPRQVQRLGPATGATDVSSHEPVSTPHSV